MGNKEFRIIGNFREGASILNINVCFFILFRSPISVIRGVAWKKASCLWLKLRLLPVTMTAVERTTIHENKHIGDVCTYGLKVASGRGPELCFVTSIN